MKAGWLISVQKNSKKVREAIFSKAHSALVTDVNAGRHSEDMDVTKESVQGIYDAAVAGGESVALFFDERQEAYILCIGDEGVCYVDFKSVSLEDAKAASAARPQGIRGLRKAVVDAALAALEAEEELPEALELAVTALAEYSVEEEEE